MVEVGRLEDFEPGTAAVREVGGRELAVIRWGDAIYAINNECPHQGGPLCLGHLGPRIHSPRRGAIELDDSRPTLACSWHGWEFDLATGSALFNEDYRVRTYPVHVDEGGTVWIDTRRRGRRRRTGSPEPAAAGSEV